MEKELELRIKKLEQRLDILSDQLNKALNYIEDDPHSSLAKSRTILEQVLLNIYKLEMNEEPRRIELGAILTDNQFTRKIDRRIVSRMNAIRDMSNLGVHGDKVFSKDAKIVLDNLCEVLEWYFENYTTVKSEIKVNDSPKVSRIKFQGKYIIFLGIFITVIVGFVIVINIFKNQKPPIILFPLVDNVTSTTANIGINISYDTNEVISECGIYYGTKMDPENTGEKQKLINNNGRFSFTISGLSSKTNYFVKAYAIKNDGEEYYSSLINFTTTPIPKTPKVVTFVFDPYYGALSFKVGGFIEEDDNGPISERGIYWGELHNPQKTGTKLKIGQGFGTFSVPMIGSDYTNKNYVVAYAINKYGISYGKELLIVTSQK